ncbi:MAG: hypothetical protein HYX75_13770 [Acidobacteria bacterium]|nr:hypothetical protein [Acidobacteriota bacterium]
MKVWDIRDKQGRLIGRHRLAKFIAKIPGVGIIRKQQPFQFLSEDEFCEFEIDRQRFIVWEPWGDSNRYWVGPKPPEWCPQTEFLRQRFAQQSAWWL